MPSPRRPSDGPVTVTVNFGGAHLAALNWFMVRRRGLNQDEMIRRIVLDHYKCRAAPSGRSAARRPPQRTSSFGVGLAWLLLGGLLGAGLVAYLTR
jgi:hypothetical protein